MSEFVKVERDGAVLVVTLARPEKKNALTGAMYEALIAAFAEASDDAEVGALLIEGSGGVFSAGNDIGDFLAFAMAPGAAMRDAPGVRFIYALARFAKPLVAAVDGHADRPRRDAVLPLRPRLRQRRARASTCRSSISVWCPKRARRCSPRCASAGRARANICCSASRSTPRRRAPTAWSTPSSTPASLHAHALAKAKALAAKPRQALLAARRLHPRRRSGADRRAWTRK